MKYAYQSMRLHELNTMRLCALRTAISLFYKMLQAKNVRVVLSPGTIRKEVVDPN